MRQHSRGQRLADTFATEYELHRKAVEHRDCACSAVGYATVHRAETQAEVSVRSCGSSMKYVVSSSAPAANDKQQLDAEQSTRQADVAFIGFNRAYWLWASGAAARTAPSLCPCKCVE